VHGELREAQVQQALLMQILSTLTMSQHSLATAPQMIYRFN
jgi:hypothetical protein